LLLSGLPAFAGPCTKAIDRAQTRFDARLKSAAAAGPAGAQSTAATTHHQPTPQSIAEAEESLGDISQDQARSFAAAMERARAADAAGNRKACVAALSEAKAALKN
jgi:hypothetical protein